MKLIKHFTIVCLVIFTLSILSGCLAPSPQSAVKYYYELMLSHKYETAEKAMTSDSKKLAFTDKQKRKFLDSVFNKCSYKILSTKIVKDTATVRVKFTAPDMKNIADVAVEDFQIRLSSKNIGNSPTIQIDTLSSNMQRSTIKYINTEFDVKLTKDKENNNWLVFVDENLIEAMSGNMLEALNTFYSQTNYIMYPEAAPKPGQ